MLAELGLFALVLALIFALGLGIIPTLGLVYARPDWQRAAPIYVWGQGLCVGLAFALLGLCFLQDDFSLRYVLANSSLQLPWFYKLCAVWGGHEGSMLLWVLILSGWMMAVSLFSQSLSLAMRTRILVVLGWVSCGFILFLLMTSNPFLRQFAELGGSGRDLNPLLQDPGFLFHPPMLYMGYVGFAVPFAFAVAALWAGRIESSWAKWTRPWTLAAWCCLTAGITLGSWWAYRELGWGGWWFWDPVENASFMPWLTGTALIHSLAVTERSQHFKAWTLLLAITAFSLSLIGTFLVRSGVLTSVHAFAVDPQRGLFILSFLALVVGGSLTLFALRAAHLASAASLPLLSRPSLLLLNNVLLVVMMLTVLLGTTYPLLIDGLGLGKLSVGAPYFNAVFVPLMLPLLLLMGIGIHLRWQGETGSALWQQLKSPLCLSLGIVGLTVILHQTGWSLLLLVGLALAIWVIVSTLMLVYLRYRSGRRPGQAFWGMVIAHIGVAVTVLGISISTGFGIQADVELHPGERYALAGYTVEFVHEQGIKGPNYTGSEAKFLVKKGNYIYDIYPQKRLYAVSKMPMTESAIDVSPWRDIYVALGEPIGKQSWSVRIYYKPLIRWIWGGGFLILMGGFLALTDRRYYLSRQSAEPALTELAEVRG